MMNVIVLVLDFRLLGSSPVEKLVVVLASEITTRATENRQGYIPARAHTQSNKEHGNEGGGIWNVGVIHFRIVIQPNPPSEHANPDRRK